MRREAVLTFPAATMAEAGLVVARALLAADPELMQAELEVLVAQTALETAHWGLSDEAKKAGVGMRCWNFGNQKFFQGGPSEDFCFYPAGENLDAATAELWLAKAKPRSDGKPGSNLVLHGNVRHDARGFSVVKDGRRVSLTHVAVTALPNHPGCAFFAFDSIEHGAAGWLRRLRRKYGPALAVLNRKLTSIEIAQPALAWPYLGTGKAPSQAAQVYLYAKKLKALGPYFTDTLSHYAAELWGTMPRYRAAAQQAFSEHKQMKQSWRQWAQALPGPGPERDKQILQAVRGGSVVVDWAWIALVDDPAHPTGRYLRVQVSGDALRIGVRNKGVQKAENDPVRVNVSAQLQQWLCDEMDCVLPTPYMVNVIASTAAYFIPPQTQTPGAQMASGEAMVTHSGAVDHAIFIEWDDDRSDRVLVDTVGKDWVLVPQLWGSLAKATQLQAAANYGWFWHGGKSGCIQPVAFNVVSLVWPHDIHHTDYSQVCRLIRRKAQLVEADGSFVEVDLADIYRHATLHRLVGLSRPLPDFRHPGVGAAPVTPPGEDEEVPSTEPSPPTAGPASLGSTWRPVLEFGMRGPDVYELEVALYARTDLGAARAGAKPDRDPKTALFGPGVRAAVLELQRVHKLVQDGKVGVQVRRVLRGEVVPVSTAGVPTGHYLFIKARWSQLGRPNGEVLGIMVHIVAPAGARQSARYVATNFKNADEDHQGNYHFVVDDVETIECVPIGDEAFGAICGRRFIHVGLCTGEKGVDWSKPQTWQDGRHRKMLGLLAELLAFLCKRTGLPVSWMTAEAVLGQVQKGITSHLYITLASKLAKERKLTNVPWVVNGVRKEGEHEDTLPEVLVPPLLADVQGRMAAMG